MDVLKNILFSVGLCINDFEFRLVLIILKQYTWIMIKDDIMRGDVLTLAKIRITNNYISTFWQRFLHIRYFVQITVIVNESVTIIKNSLFNNFIEFNISIETLHLSVRSCSFTSAGWLLREFVYFIRILG